MSFPNAYSGVKKIFTSQILILIGAVLVGIAAAVGSSVIASGTSIQVNVGTTGASAGIALVGAVLVIVGYIINIVGLYQAGKDERRYLRPAFIIVIIALVLSIIAGLFSDNIGLQNAASFISKVAEIVVMIFTVAGISELANKLNRPQIARFGTKVLILIIIAQALAIIVKMIGSGNAAMAVAIASLILTVVGYIAYLVFLSKGKNMLKTS